MNDLKTLEKDRPKSRSYPQAGNAEGRMVNDEWLQATWRLLGGYPQALW
jgi:hypothetical protein